VLYNRRWAPDAAGEVGRNLRYREGRRKGSIFVMPCSVSIAVSIQLSKNERRFEGVLGCSGLRLYDHPPPERCHSQRFLQFISSSDVQELRDDYERCFPYLYEPTGADYDRELIHIKFEKEPFRTAPFVSFCPP